jgi:rod shape-determining protein MreB
MLSKLARIISHPNIAVDLGTANTRIYTSLQGEVTEMPSSINHVTGTADNISDEYLQFMNNRISTKPLRGGVIVDLRNAIELLKPLVKKSRKFFLAPISLASAPTDTTEKERDLLRKALIMAGASHVSIIPEVWAAAIGAGIDITQPHAQLLIDIGDGVTDMALFCNGRIIHSSSIRIACSDLQRAVRSAVMSKYRVQLYDADIEKLTHSISSILNQKELNSETFDISGLDIVRRSKVHCCIDKTDIVDAIVPVVNKIIMMIETSLKKLPEKTYCEILESGIYLTGGGACIEGMAKLIAFRTHMEVRIPLDPIHAVINGAIKTLDYWKGNKYWREDIAWPTLST